MNNINVKTIYSHTDDGRAFIRMRTPMGTELNFIPETLRDSIGREFNEDGMSVRVGGDGEYEYDIVEVSEWCDVEEYRPFNEEFVRIPLAFEPTGSRFIPHKEYLVCCVPFDWEEQYNMSGFIPKRYALMRRVG